jgi:hypothetical protein
MSAAVTGSGRRRWQRLLLHKQYPEVGCLSSTSGLVDVRVSYSLDPSLPRDLYFVFHLCLLPPLVNTATPYIMRLQYGLCDIRLRAQLYLILIQHSYGHVIYGTGTGAVQLQCAVLYNIIQQRHASLYWATDYRKKKCCSKYYILILYMYCIICNF